MVNRHAALFHHLLEVPVAQRVGRIPADADQDHIDRKAHPFEVEHINSSRVRALKFTRLASRLSLMRQNPLTSLDYRSLPALSTSWFPFEYFYHRMLR